MIKECIIKPSTHQLPENCPTTGQFIAIWEHDDKVWSDTYKWDGTVLYLYNSNNDDYTVATESTELAWMNHNNTTSKFYIYSNNE